MAPATSTWPRRRRDLLAAWLLACGAHGAVLHSDNSQGPSDCGYMNLYPRQYVAYKTNELSPAALDGDLTKKVWAEVDWTADFVDIATKTIPKFRTRAKMRWDDEYLYVAAEMEEPDIWATLHEHNSVIFHDNDFEVFVDPNATTHFYKEFEMNAFGTTWDLCLNKPYDDGGYENSSRLLSNRGFEMQPPTRNAVKIFPTAALNNPQVRGADWTIEVALPLKDLALNSTTAMPSEGTFWRLGFSRVEWNVVVDEATGKYKKDPSCQSCAKPGTKAEDNWVWSAQGAVAMHLPERWGILQFAEGAPSSTAPSHYAEWSARGAAMAIYYAQKAYAKDHDGEFADSVEKLSGHSQEPFQLCGKAETKIAVSSENGSPTFVATVWPPGDKFEATIRNDRFLTVARREGEKGKGKVQRAIGGKGAGAKGGGK